METKKNPEKKHDTLYLIRSFARFMKGSLVKYLGAMVCVLVAVTASFMTPLFVSSSVDAITATLNGEGATPVGLPGLLGVWFNARGASAYMASHMWVAAIMLAACALIGGVFQFLRGKWLAEAGEGITERLRNSLYERLQYMSYDYHVKAETGDLIQRCTSDVDLLRRFVQDQLIELFRTIIMVVMALTLMSRIHVKLTLISLTLIPFLFLLAFIFFRWIQKVFMEADEADGKLSAMLQESLTGVRVVRAFARGQYERERFGERADDVYNKSVRITNAMSFYWGGSDGLSMLQTGITLACGVYFAILGELTAGNIIVFVSYISMLIYPIRQMGRILSDFGKALVSLRRIFEILDAEPEQDTPGASEAPLYETIEFKHVAFSYNEKTPVLKDISFTAKPGETIAILGATGCGKSTMMNLLQRLYDPTAGEIMIGGREIRTIAKPHLRARVGYVLQEPFLYSRSLKDNITITEKDATQADIDRAAETTRSTGFIANFEKGYETMVGERGVTLSGGQKQRVAIARTLMRDNDILILDDSLSAVDTETDKAIREALQTQRRNGGRVPTTFIISHRITTLADADRILVLEDGVIAQQGTHEELVAVDGLYRRVYRIQAALEDELRNETA